MTGAASAFNAFRRFLSRPLSPDLRPATGTETRRLFKAPAATAARASGEPAARVPSSSAAASTCVAWLDQACRVESPSIQSLLPGVKVKDVAGAAGSAPARAVAASKHQEAAATSEMSRRAISACLVVVMGAMLRWRRPIADTRRGETRLAESGE